MMLPCASRVKIYDGSEVGGEEDCIWDKNEVEDYLGKAYYMKAFINLQKFMPDKYDDHGIERKLEVKKLFFNGGNPSWYDASVVMKKLIDETDMLQLGQSEEQDFASIEIGDK